MSALVKYEAACRAIAEAIAVDEVMQIRGQAEMMQAAARIAKNRDLEIQAVELRWRGERRLGELLKAANEAGQIGRGRPAKNCQNNEHFPRVRLEEAGIDRGLSSRAQKLAAVPTSEFEGLISTWRSQSSALDGRLTTDLLRVGAEQRQREQRRELAIALSDKAVELTGERKYPAGHIDFPWRRKQGVTDRSYENHYPTMTWDEIIQWCLKWRDRFLEDAWFFIWIPRAHMFALHPVEHTIDIGGGEIIKVDIPMPLAWAVARALGATAYSTAFIWTKTDEEYPDDIGSGILVRDQDEILLMFKRGRGLPKPASNEIEGSNHRERSRPLGHSRKPQFYREMIARMVGHGVPVLECFARHDEQFPLPEGWDAWGNQAQPAAAEGEAA
jgi:N6-adenosine-specific RNA methylase IME4